MKFRYYLIFLVIYGLNLASVFSFFSDATELNLSLTTGSVDFIIDKLQVENHTFGRAQRHIVDSNQNENLNGGTLVPNSLVAFTFSVKNIGNSTIQYHLTIGIAWDEELSESGKFLLYPYNMNNETIYQDIASDSFEHAIINTDVSDAKNIPNHINEKLGIMEILDSATLNSVDTTETSFKSYGFKIFLHEDDELKLNPNLFEGKSFDVSIIVTADLDSMTSNWWKSEKRIIRFMSKTDLSTPVIEEIVNPKKFFISQADNINLADYARAVDSMDGLITEDIIITSSPEFNPKKSDNYTITYNVTNSFGKKAIPLEITIVVWDFIKITSGNYHSLALTSDGKVYSWGYNANGQLGDGTTRYSATPKLVQGLSNIIDIATGTGCSFALSIDGQAYAWGYNYYGRLGDSTTTSRSRPVKVKQPEEVKFIQLSARFASVGAITAEGDVYTWGYSGYGTLGNGSSVENRIPTKINLSNIVHLEMGYYNGAAITRDGQLYTWGDNLNGQLGNGANMAVSTNAPAIVPFFNTQGIKIRNVSVGWYHMTAISENGELYTWGYAAEGRLGNNIGSNKNTPQKIAVSGIAVKAVAAYYHTAVMTSTGQAYFFGQNTFGKHGTGTTSNNWLPTYLSSVANVIDIALALDSSFVLTDSGEVYGMGYGDNGILGTGNSNNSIIPVKWAFTPPLPY